jgi:2'-5' RNA ligase
MRTVHRELPAPDGVEEKSRFRYTFAMAETALVVLFRQLDPLIGELRRRYTASGAEGLGAHATLIVPFFAFSTNPRTLQPFVLAAETIAPFAPFELTFRETARFPASAGEPSTLYLVPEPAEDLIVLTDALVRAFPDFPPYGGAFDELVPHVTVAQGDEELLREIEQQVRPRLPAGARADRAWLVEHTPDGWRRRSAFPLLGRKLA